LERKEAKHWTSNTPDGTEVTGASIEELVEKMMTHNGYKPI